MRGHSARRRHPFTHALGARIVVRRLLRALQFSSRSGRVQYALERVKLGIHHSGHLQECQEVNAFRLALDCLDPLDELFGMDLAISVVQDREELLQVPDLHIHGGKKLPHEVVAHQLLELLRRHEAVARVVKLLEDHPQLLRVDLVGPLGAHHHDFVVAGGNAGGLRDEHGGRHIDQSKTEDAPVEHDEEAPPFIDLAHEQPGRGRPISDS
mmetsp:Transcript_64900/g.156869  ORF Transcript_64900/g.156869 Transcript_64900/m.156869 type:complete len:211 (-) Transcript_64900:1254-1886(-)